jgi:hypothetical protein
MKGGRQRSNDFNALSSNELAIKAEPAVLLRFVLTDYGARVALQRCPILRAGGEDFITRVNLAMVDLYSRFGIGILVCC